MKLVFLASNLISLIVDVIKFRGKSIPTVQIILNDRIEKR